MVFSPGDEVTVSRTETRTVTVKTVTNAGKCFIGTDNLPYHVKGGCGVYGALGSDIWEVESVRKPEPENWPPQENDVWQTVNYTLHFFNGRFSFKNMHSASVTEIGANEVKSWEPRLLFRVK